MRSEGRRRQIFRAMIRHKDEADEVRTPATASEQLQIPHHPNKKRSFLRRHTNELTTPTNTKKANSSRNILSNTTNFTKSNTLNDDYGSQPPNLTNHSANCYHHANNNITNTTITTSTTDGDVIIRQNLGSAGINTYDYKTFSTKRPLRISKLRALEESEMTSRLHFQKFDSELDNRSDNNSEEEDDMIVQIPNLSKEETKNLFKKDAISKNGKYQNGSLDRRLNVMKNAFKPLSKSEILHNKLQTSKLPNVFQNSPEFLKSFELENVEIWESLSDEFDNEMKELAQSIDDDFKRQRCLSALYGEYHLLDLPLDKLYGPKSKGQDLGPYLSKGIRKTVKDLLNKEDTEFN